MHLLSKVTLILLLVVVVGCSKPLPGEAQANAQLAPAVKTSTKAKPGAAVELSNSPYFLESPGVSSLDLQLVSAKEFERMEVEVSSGDGLEILSGPNRFEFGGEQGARKNHSIPLTISVSKEGRFYINLHIALYSQGRRENRVVVGIVQVGGRVVRANKHQGAAVDEANTPAIIDMPAQETVRSAD